MKTKREWLYCHSCHNVQRDCRAYRDHLLRVHGEVTRRGSDDPVHLERRELEVVSASAHRSRMSGPVRAAHCREAMGLPRVSDREAERRLKNNRSRTAQRHRAAARARKGATAALGRRKTQRRQHCWTQFEETSMKRSDMSHKRAAAGPNQILCRRAHTPHVNDASTAVVAGEKLLGSPELVPFSSSSAT